ncbi:uncharacterized protein EV420DRAFT_1487297 [Desarmillaria tabescens]|uniref:Uncharacterized protein n=1 Tax=Armillaria tabescens TaxID=1929756 RepID=A0AA39J6F9_ARMTA|nr:uncharacterized protein EV420DRAFT_1487297 [Desarmillaria tabescens]KAK0436971.1 hypothetical protein EV420DRAFT_1487297 [Desarmillaria tabescens]
MPTAPGTNRSYSPRDAITSLMMLFPNLRSTSFFNVILDKLPIHPGACSHVKEVKLLFCSASVMGMNTFMSHFLHLDTLQISWPELMLPPIYFYKAKLIERINAGCLSAFLKNVGDTLHEFSAINNDWPTPDESQFTKLTWILTSLFPDIRIDVRVRRSTVIVPGHEGTFSEMSLQDLPAPFLRLLRVRLIVTKKERKFYDSSYTETTVKVIELYTYHSGSCSSQN